MAVVQKLTANSGKSAATAAAASPPGRPANSQRTAVKPRLPRLSSVTVCAHAPLVFLVYFFLMFYFFLLYYSVKTT